MSQPSHVVSGKSHLGILMMLAWPAILEQLLLTLVRYVDTAMVGSLGANATAAVAINASPTWLISSILSAIGVGYSVQVAHSIGAKDKQATARIVRQALLAVLFMGISIMLICLLIAPHLPKWMGAQPDVLPDAVRYLQIYVLSLPFQCGSYTFSAVLRCMGDTKTPLILNTAANLLNVVLNFFLIFPTRPTELFGMSFTVPGAGWGVAGAAIATDISQLLSAVLCMLYLMHVNESYKVVLRKIRIHKTVAIRIIQVGVPTAIQNTVISFANVLVQASVNSYGALAMAGFAAYIKIDGFNILPVMSFSMAATTFSGQNYGAGNMERVRKGMRVTVAMGVIYCICVGSILLLFAHPLIGIFSKDPTVIEFGVRAMLYFCPFYFLLAIMHGLAGAIRGIGKSVPPMVIILFSLCVYRVIWIRLAVPHIPTIDGVYMVYPISWLIGAILMVIYTKTAFPKQASTQNISL